MRVRKRDLWRVRDGDPVPILHCTACRAEVSADPDDYGAMEDHRVIVCACGGVHWRIGRWVKVWRGMRREE